MISAFAYERSGPGFSNPAPVVRLFFLRFLNEKKKQRYLPAQSIPAVTLSPTTIIPQIGDPDVIDSEKR